MVNLVRFGVDFASLDIKQKNSGAVREFHSG
jgi:hypothetical protein